MLSAQIRHLAKTKGIDIVRITHADPFEGYPLPNSPRRDPHLSLLEARCLIVFGVYIGGFNLPDWDNPSVGRTSRLFLSGFFSDVVEPLKSISHVLQNQGFSALICDGFQSGGSILPLKLAAVRAGMGWQAKNTLMISTEYGSFLALGGIVTDAPLVPDAGRERDRCGQCRACQEACPTGALDEPYRLNRQRCLSYLLQEPSFPQELYQPVKNRVADCEICQTACPWNKKHMKQPRVTMRTRLFRERADTLTRLFELFNLTKLGEREYEGLIGSYRTGIPYKIFRRNVVAALGHSNRSDAIPLLESALEATDPEVRKVARVSMKMLQDSGEAREV